MKTWHTITCTITGMRRFSSDLPQGGLELPCEYTFTGSEDIVRTTRQCLMEENTAVNEVVLVRPIEVSSCNCTNSPLTDHDEFSEDKVKIKDVITIKEEAVDSSTRSDDDMMAWVKIEDFFDDRGQKDY